MIRQSPVTRSRSFLLVLYRRECADKSPRIFNPFSPFFVLRERFHVGSARQQLIRFSTGAIPRYSKRPEGKRKAQIWMLQGIPEIGPERAHRLIEKYGSIEAICKQNVQQLTSVYGIGQKAARAIRWVVG